MNLAEVLVLAFALNVPPGVLIFPVGYERQTEILPDAWIEPAAAAEWLAGRTFFNDEAAEDFHETPLGLIRQHQDSATALRRAILAREHALRELTRAEMQHADDAQAFEQLTAQTEGIRRRIDEVAAAARHGAEYDRDEVKRLSVEHKDLMEQVDAVRGGAGSLKYAQQRVEAATAQVRQRETALRDIRRKIQDRGLHAPLLPSALIYIDPESIPLEDVPAKRFPSDFGHADGLVASSGNQPAEVIRDDQADLVFAGAEAEKVRIREVLEELQPRLESVINEAIEEAFRRRDKEGE